MFLFPMIYVFVLKIRKMTLKIVQCYWETLISGYGINTLKSPFMKTTHQPWLGLLLQSQE